MNGRLSGASGFAPACHHCSSGAWCRGGARWSSVEGLEVYLQGLRSNRWATLPCSFILSLRSIQHLSVSSYRVPGTLLDATDSVYPRCSHLGPHSRVVGTGHRRPTKITTTLGKKYAKKKTTSSSSLSQLCISSVDLLQSGVITVPFSRVVEIQ
ncbi:hypothetical protein HJG60_009267 [Phyllostomus discolor]|uniref:Uncharacterized protein n=1 Tax=Phyllostomus discolor TaxID=89673 RepID=A0A834DF81_9CHIR|nr:hypothetical protein HJG60_009267 [Phyllostomus discolor]